MKKIGMLTSSIPYSVSKQAEYVDRIVRELKASRGEKKPPTTDQSESTKRILARDPSQDEHYFNRPLPENWKAVPEAKSTDEAVGKRDLDPEQVSHFEAVRRRSKNTLGDAVSEGATSVSQEKIDRAIEAFTFSPPADLSEAEMVKLKALSPYSPLPEITEEPKKESFFKRLFKRKKRKELWGLKNGQQTFFGEIEDD